MLYHYNLTQHNLQNLIKDRLKENSTQLEV